MQARRSVSIASHACMDMCIDVSVRTASTPMNADMCIMRAGVGGDNCGRMNSTPCWMRGEWSRTRARHRRSNQDSVRERGRQAKARNRGGRPYSPSCSDPCQSSRSQTPRRRASGGQISAQGVGVGESTCRNERARSELVCRSEARAPQPLRCCPKSQENIGRTLVWPDCSYFYH